MSDESDRALVRAAADAAGITLATSREGDPERADEFRVAENGSVLGRTLVAIGAPLGEKNAESTVVLPGYLSDAPDVIRREFVWTYLSLRGAEHAGKDTLTVREERSDRYLRSLANLFRDVLDGEATVSGKNLIVSAEAARTFRSWPTPLQD